MRNRKQSWPYTLGEVPLFADCSATELEGISSLLTAVDVRAGTPLLREDEHDWQFIVIAEGYAQVTRGGRDVAVVGPGTFIGEIALLERVPRSATVTAVTPLTVYVANAAEFATLLDLAPSVAEKVRATAASRLEANRQAA